MTDRRAFLAGAATSLLATRAQSRAPFAVEEATIAGISSALAAGVLTCEALVAACLARIARYDGAIRAVITLNPHARRIARDLDRERARKGPRSPLHGVPVVLKDNIDTADMPTSGGSFVLADSVPSRDALVVERLRAAGAIILAKVNLSEFAAGPPSSSVHGQTHNPYNLDYIAGGSSGGSGAAIAAGYAVLALGTDTGGSVRGPSSIDGIVGLKPTNGLLSMNGVIPLALTFDTIGPMARTVRDVAVALGVMAANGTNYAATLDPQSLSGARIGLVRTFTGNSADHDRAIEATAATIRRAGGVVEDVRYPDWLMAVKGSFYTTVRWPEFRPQMDAYLGRLGPGAPRDLADLARRSRGFDPHNRRGFVDNSARWDLFDKEIVSGSLDDPDYRTIRDKGLALIREGLTGIMDAGRYDALLYLTTSVRPPLVKEPNANNTTAAFASTAWGTQFASLAGLPDLVVPCGYTHDGLPIGMSLMGRRLSEARLLSLGHAFESLARVRRAPIMPPPGSAT